MPQCEMCGAEESSLTTTKVEGAELELCDSCSDFGTTVETQSSSTSDTKYSTSSSGGSNTSSSSSTSSSGGRRHDMFDEMETLAADYDERIRRAREQRGMSQEDLADRLNEKRSTIRKLERGDVLPSDDVQAKLEKALDISLTDADGADDEEWSSDSSDSMTLGDVVKRED